jgi:hypothetical protein
MLSSAPHYHLLAPYDEGQPFRLRSLGGVLRDPRVGRPALPPDAIDPMRRLAGPKSRTAPLTSLRVRLVRQRFDVGDQPNEIVFGNLSGKGWHLRFIFGDDPRIRQQDGLAYISFVRNDGAAVLERHRLAIQSLQPWRPQRARSHVAAAATELLKQRCAFARERAARRVSARSIHVPIRSNEREEQDKRQQLHHDATANAKLR